MTKLAFVIPGDINLPTGGYAYDRAVLKRLSAFGVDATHVALPGTYPAPTEADLTETEGLVAATPGDCVLLIDGLAYGAMPAMPIARFKRPIIALCHHPLHLEAGTPPSRQIYLRQTEAMALKLADHTIVTSAMTGKIVSADFGIPPSAITVAEPGTDRSVRASGTGRPLKILAVGSVVPRKAYTVLIEALATLKRHDWLLDIAGAVRDEAEHVRVQQAILTSGLEGRVRLLGPVTSEDLDRLYASADVFVLASLFEGFGMVLTEALARGLAIVSTTGGAAAETLPAGTALKVPPGDPVALANALERVIDNPDMRQSLSDAAWQAAQHLTTWDDTARIIAGVVHRVARSTVAP